MTRSGSPNVPIATKTPPNNVTILDLEIYKDVRELAGRSMSRKAKAAKATQSDKHNPKSIIMARHEVDTWYPSPFPEVYLTQPKLYICEFCLKFDTTQDALDQHSARCKIRCPPGNEIYRNNDLSVFEVNGDVSTNYCRRLCLISKLFLECKTLCVEVEPFNFYVITKNDNYGCHIAGYFCKQKIVTQPLDVDDQNLSCFMVLPQYQKQGLGTFIIELSYALSRIEGVPGTPERPLTEFGEICYGSYWRKVVLDYLHAHRANETLYISDMIKKTGMVGADIVNTLNNLGFLRSISSKKRKRSLRSDNRISICIDWDRVDAHVIVAGISPRIPLYMNLLQHPKKPTTSDEFWVVLPPKSVKLCTCCDEPVNTGKVPPLKLRKIINPNDIDAVNRQLKLQEVLKDTKPNFRVSVTLERIDSVALTPEMNNNVVEETNSGLLKTEKDFKSSTGLQNLVCNMSGTLEDIEMM